jgi:hypothetical protein
MSVALDLSSYCTHVPLMARMRLDLFTERAFRLRLSRMQGDDPFPPAYEIPFAMGKHIHWVPVAFTRTETDEDVVVTTAVLCIRFAKFDFRFTVWTADAAGLRIEVGAAAGAYRGAPAQRTWDLEVRALAAAPQQVRCGSEVLTRAEGGTTPGTWSWDAGRAILTVRGQRAAATDGCVVGVDSLRSPTKGAAS